MPPWRILCARGLAATWLALGLLMLVGRLHFVRVHGGLDTDDGRGSPVVFLDHLLKEQAFFTTPGVLALLALRRGRSEGERE